MGTQDPTTRDFSLDVLGEQVNARTLDEALHAASLDWRVLKQPLTTYAEELSDEGVTRHELEVPGKFAIVRETIGETIPFRTIGVVGDRYVPVQNEVAFGFVDDLLDMGGDELLVEFAGSMYEGRKVFLDVKLPKTIMVGGDDAVETRLLCVNTHDGTAPFSLSLHINRLACTNQIETTKRHARDVGQHWSIRHTTSVEGRVQQARESLRLTFAAVEEFEREAQELIAKSITDRQFERLIESVFPTPGVGASEKAKRAVADTRLAVRTIYRESPTQESIKGTAWGALNAFVEYADWSREVRPGKRDAAEARALAQLDSRHVVNFKSNVMGRVLALK